MYGRIDLKCQQCSQKATIKSVNLSHRFSFWFYMTSKSMRDSSKMELLENRRWIFVFYCVILTIKGGPVASFMCTRGAEYLFCHKVEVKGANVNQREIRVYTVHECRDKCDEDHCIAFQYNAHTSSRQQGCKLFSGSSSQVTLTPDSCTDDYWTYSWHREEYMKKLQGSCPVPKGKFDKQ